MADDAGWKKAFHWPRITAVAGLASLFILAGVALLPDSGVDPLSGAAVVIGALVLLVGLLPEAVAVRRLGSDQLQTVRKDVAEVVRAMLQGRLRTQSPVIIADSDDSSTESSRRGLTAHERQTVEEIRTLYRGYGRASYSVAYNLLRRLKNDLAGKRNLEDERANPLTRLLEVPLDDLKSSADLLEKGVRDEARIPPDQVKDRFYEFFRDYMSAVRIMHDLQLEGFELENGPHEGQYREWWTRHSSFVEKLRDRLERSDLSDLKEFVYHVRFDLYHFDSPVPTDQRVNPREMEEG